MINIRKSARLPTNTIVVERSCERLLLGRIGASFEAVLVLVRAAFDVDAHVTPHLGPGWIELLVWEGIESISQLIDVAGLIFEVDCEIGHFVCVIIPVMVDLTVSVFVSVMVDLSVSVCMMVFGMSWTTVDTMVFVTVMVCNKIVWLMHINSTSILNGNRCER